MTKRIYRVIISLLVASTAFSCKYDRSAKSTTISKQLYDSAFIALNNGHFEKAESFMDSLSRVRPSNKNNVRNKFLKGRLLAEKGRQDDALELFKRSFRDLEDRKDTLLLANILSYTALAYMVLGQNDSSEVYFHRSIAICNEPGYHMTNYGRLGLLMYYQYMDEQAMEYYLRALEMAEKLGKRISAGDILGNMGNLRVALGEWDLAIADYKKAAKIASESNRPNVLSIVDVNLGTTYLYKGDLDSAGYYLRKALALAKEIDFPRVCAHALRSLGRVHTAKGELDKGYELLMRSQEIYLSIESKTPNIDVICGLSENFQKQKNYDRAAELLQKARDLAEKRNEPDYIIMVCDQQATVDSLRGNYLDAYKHYHRAVQVRDSMEVMKKNIKFQTLREQFASEQKAKIIAEQKLTIQEKDQYYTIMFIVALTVVFCLIMILLVYRIRQKQKLNRLQKLEHDKRMKAVVETQENVVKKVARDLHDSVGQRLAAVKISLSTVKTDDPKKLDTMNMLDDTCEEVRVISHQLLPQVLMHNGLITAVDALLSNSFCDGVTSYEFNREEIDDKIPEAIGIALFRSAQELVKNVIKHARATMVKVNFAIVESELIFSFQDDGTGFSLSLNKSGIGLLNIKSRIDLVNGQLHINTAPGAGTKTVIRVPLESHWVS